MSLASVASGSRNASLSWSTIWNDWSLSAKHRPRPPAGQRPVNPAPFGHWRTQTFVGTLRHDRLDAPWVIDGAMNAGIFGLYAETQLVPTLREGEVVILDDLSSHKAPAAAAALRAVGAWFLPPPTAPTSTP
ncbi:transposase [Paracoccus sp. (in: a-proteobacteria)]|uniref:transposase n=1 Tax=Paracoccus sp. TaxID=267 RepID=UPI003A89BC91